MKIILKQNTCIIIREQGDPVFSGVKNAAGESRLLYHVKQIINAAGEFDFIKKRMWKDGHLVDDLQQYLTIRHCKPDQLQYIYNDRWAIAGAEEPLNKTGRVDLVLVWGDNAPVDRVLTFYREYQKTY